MNTIKTKQLSDLLKNVYLGGIIPECIININKKSFKIEAVDPTNTLIFIDSSIILKEKEKENQIGIPNINLLNKFLSTIEDKKLLFKLEDNNLILTRKDKRRKLKLVLSSPETITTALLKDDEDEDTKQIMLDMQDYKIDLPKDFISDFLTYIGLSESKDVSMTYDKKLIVTIGSNISHQFTIEVDKEHVSKMKKKDKTIDLKINGDFLARVFSVIGSSAFLYIANEKPIVIQEGTTMWAIAPLVEEE
jgi:hypothetical protein